MPRYSYHCATLTEDRAVTSMQHYRAKLFMEPVFTISSLLVPHLLLGAKEPVEGSRIKSMA